MELFSLAGENNKVAITNCLQGRGAKESKKKSPQLLMSTNDMLYTFCRATKIRNYNRQIPRAHVSPVEKQHHSCAPSISLAGCLQRGASVPLVGIRPVYIPLVRDTPHDPFHVTAGCGLNKVGCHRLGLFFGCHRYATLGVVMASDKRVTTRRDRHRTLLSTLCIPVLLFGLGQRYHPVKQICSTECIGELARS